MRNKTVIPENKLDSQSLPGKAADFIRAQIIQGVFEQGARLVEEELSESLGVSRACIREALLCLETEGLVKRERNRYTEVIKLDGKDIEEIFSLRTALEVLSAQTCILKRTVPFERLNRCLNEISRLAESDQKNFIKRIEADLDFHETIVVSSGNTRVINIWKSIKSQMLTAFYSIPRRHLQYFDLHSIENHIRIIKAFEKNDLNEVASLLQEHVKVTSDYLIGDVGG